LDRGGSASFEREAVTDFVAGAGRGEMALEEKELAGGKAREPGFRREVRGEGAEIARAVAAFAAGQGDVGMVGAVFCLEAAGGSGGDDALLEREERGCGLDAEVQNACAREDSRRGEQDGNGRALKPGELVDDTRVLLGSGGAEELKGNVPGFGRGPAKARRASSKAGGKAGEPGEEGFVERQGEEEAHGGSVCKGGESAGSRVSRFASRRVSVRCADLRSLAELLRPLLKERRKDRSRARMGHGHGWGMGTDGSRARMGRGSWQGVGARPLA
jgi:hypothetical protein